MFCWVVKYEFDSKMIKHSISFANKYRAFQHYFPQYSNNDNRDQNQLFDKVVEAHNKTSILIPPDIHRYNFDDDILFCGHKLD